MNRCFLLLVLATILLLCSETLLAAEPSDDKDFVFIENADLRVGVKQSSGAGIAWISLAGSKQNLVDHYDRGRLVQQSYYGAKDDSLWNKQPWRWNPVQGGDWRGSGAKVLELKPDKTTLYAKTLPKHWASGADLEECQMEQWLTLTGPVLHVRYRFTYSGETKHPLHDQEVPAFFVPPQYDTLVLYDGDKPWRDEKLSRSVPGWPNEARRIRESWAAYVDKDDRGIGAYVPVAKTLTCYRFGNGDPKQGACSYFAPLVQFAVEPGLKWEYDLYVTVGKSNEIRQRFAEIHNKTP